MRNPTDFSLACPAPKASGKHFLAALLIGTTLCLPSGANAQSSDLSKELYNAPLQAPVSGGIANSRAQYVIPGTRSVSGDAALPSPKLLKRPEDLPTISLPTNAAPVRRASGTTLPAYPTRAATTTTRTLTSGSTVQNGGVVRVVPPVIIESPINEMPAQEAPILTTVAEPKTIPFAKTSAPQKPAPLVASAPTAKPVFVEAPAPQPAPKPIAPKPIPVPVAPIVPVPIAPAPIVPTPAAPVTPAPLVTAPVPQFREEPITPLPEVDDAPLPWQNKDIAPFAEPLPAEPLAAEPVFVEPAPAVVVAPVETAAPEEFTEVAPAPVPLTAAPVTPAPVKTETAPVLIPQTIDETAPVSPVVAAPVVEPAPELSEKSRFILEQTPKGIAPKREVIARSPKPVIIKREDPKAGNIPTFDVRAHEELGMKIEVRKTNPNINGYLEQGYENIIAGRYQIAAGYYEEALKAEPRNEMAMFGLGTTYQKLGRNEEARDTYAKLLSFNPNHLEALNNFMALASEEAPAAAIAELEKMERESPDFSPIPAQIGIIHSKQGNYAAAAEKLARALNLSPENNAYKYNLAIALDKLGQGEQASTLYLQLIAASNAGQVTPGDPETIRNRVIFLSQKRP